MPFKKLIAILTIICIVLIFEKCSKKDATVTPVIPGAGGPALPTSPYNYSNVIFPAHIANFLPTVDNTPANNRITDDGATLGRVLFYDKHLSKNNTVSCASCHSPEFSFNDTAKLSKGFAGGLTARNSMSLLNLRFYASGKMFWDERAASLEEQVLVPIQNVTEMGITLTELVSKVDSQTYYPALFTKAFGTAQVTSDRISKALSQFLRSIVTYQAKYDRVKQGLATFTTDEQQGEFLFMTAGPIACGGCHAPPMFETSSPVGPFGLPDPTDHGINNQNRFKSGSLRNIGSALNLFHNGSVRDVQTMLGANIPAHSVPPQDRARLLAFLQTLTDNAVTADPKFLNPFQ